MSGGVAVEQVEWSASVEHALRRLSAVTWAGALSGLVVGGVGGRLAMLVLARLNPEATGIISDDGFRIGQFTAATLNLLLIGSGLGVLGAGLYFVLRGLFIGPRWFQVLSISVGPAVVVGSMLVHLDGVDFTLDPAWLGVAMFVAIPGLYAAMLTVFAERWLGQDGFFVTGNRWVALLPLLLWAPIAPALALLLLGMLAFEVSRRTEAGQTLTHHPASAWAARAALAAIFVLAAVDLTRDTLALA